MRRYRIFLASSANLKAERDKFESEINELNTDYGKKLIHFELVIWEYLDAAVDVIRKQNSYNEELKTCDVLVLMYWGELGKFTKEEYLLAFNLFREKGKPRIYIFKKTAPLAQGYVPRQDNVDSLKLLEKELNAEGREQWPVSFDHHDTMLKKFRKDLINLLDDPNFGLEMLPEVKVARYDNLVKDIELFGRDEAIQKISGYLFNKDIGLITLLGPGGSGKSTLANRVAHENAEKFSNGAILVELAPLREESMVVLQIINTLKDAKIEFSDNPDDKLVEFLKTKNLLIILDNCEHLIDKCRIIISKIIRNCDHVKIIATTQVGFNMQYEKVVRVEPLERPDKSMPDSKLKTNPCVQLFLQQAQNIEPKFKLSDRTREHVIDICNYRGGIPLGIILAASAMYVKSVEDIKNNIKHSIEGVGESFDDGIQRHQSIEKAVEWSYNLLNDVQKNIFMRLSVFADDFTEDAAMYVTGSMSNFSNNFLQLINSSIVSRNTSHFLQSKIFFLLEPIRLFGQKILKQDQSYEATRERFIEYYLDLATQFTRMFFSKEQTKQLNLVKEQYNNIIGAINMAVELKDQQSAAKITSLLWRFWEVRAQYKEGMQRIENVLNEEQNEPETYLELLHGLGMLYYRAGNIDHAKELFQTHLDASQKYSEFKFGKMNVGHALNNIANAKMSSEFDTAKKLLESAYDIFIQFDDLRTLGVLQNNLGNIYHNKYELDTAFDYYSKSIETFERMNNLWESGYPLYGLGSVQFQKGDLLNARRSLETGYERRKQAADKRNMGRCQNQLALVDLQEGTTKNTLKRLEESFTLLHEVSDKLSLRELYLTIIRYCYFIGYYEMAVNIFAMINFKYADERYRKQHLEEPVSDIITTIRNNTDPAMFDKWMEATALDEKEIMIKMKKFNRPKK